jgi:hypothetical protein
LAGILIAHLGGGVTNAVWPVVACTLVAIFSLGEEAPLSQLGKNRGGWKGVEKFWMALPNRKKISKVTKE